GYPRAQCGYFRCLRSIDFEDACGGQKTAKKLRPKPVRNLNVRGIRRPAANFFRPFNPWDRFADEFECHLSPPSETRVEDGGWKMAILDPPFSTVGLLDFYFGEHPQRVLLEYFQFVLRRQKLQAIDDGNQIIRRFSRLGAHRAA